MNCRSQHVSGVFCSANISDTGLITPVTSGRFTVAAYGADNWGSYDSIEMTAAHVFEAEDPENHWYNLPEGKDNAYPGYSGKGYLIPGSEILLKNVPAQGPGYYDMYIRYSNGTDNNATNSIWIGGKRAMRVTLPPTGSIPQQCQTLCWETQCPKTFYIDLPITSDIYDKKYLLY